MLVLATLLACGLPPADADADTDTDPAVPVTCTTIVGTGSIAIVTRADVAAIVTPAAPPTGEEAAISLAGPDSRGRYYLVEPTGVVKRSDDGGCTWAAVGTLPGAEAPADTAGADTAGADTAWGPRYVQYTLSTAPTTDRVYASDLEHLLVSVDGATWTERTPVALRIRARLVIDPADADRVRGYAADGIVTSTDGGATWATTPVPDPETGYNGAIDRADPDRIALSARGLWVATDGVTWQDRGHRLQAALAWDAGSLLALYSDPDDASLRLRRSDDAGVSFTDLPMERDPDASVYILDADGGLVASGGYRYVSGEAPTGLVQLTTAAGTTVHHVAGYEGVSGFAFGADRVLVALQGPSIWSPG